MLRHLLLFAIVARVFAGLEDAKHSKRLSAANFDSVIQGEASKGALVAFFAPWCGHCKNLAPAWDKVAADFENEPGCIVGHLDADEAANKPIAHRYGVSGYPTLKFFPGKGQPPEDYKQGRSESALRDYLNERCGTDRQAGGLLGANAGRIPGLDEIAQKYLGTSTTDRTDLLESAKAIAKTVSDSSAAYYLKVMEKLDLQETTDYVQKELARLQKLAARKGAVAGSKLDELQLKQNVLRAFESLQESAQQVYDQASEAVESAAQKVKQEL